MKKFISILLCVAMLMSVVSVIGFAEEPVAVETTTLSAVSSKRSDADYPIVFVTGIGQSYSYFYENADDADNYYKLLEEVKAGTAAEGVRETDGATTRWNLFCNDFSFAFKEFPTYVAILRVVAGLLLSQTGINMIPKSAVNKVVTTLFRYNIIDEEGNLPKNVITPRADCSVAEMTEEQKENFYRAIPCQDVVEGIGEDMLYCFNYSAFSFTYNNAKDLNDFINNVVCTEENGYDKVVLVPMSMGASVVSAYLHKYGVQNIGGVEGTRVARVVSIVGAWDGSDVFADLIEQKYAADAPEKLYNGIVSELVGEPWGYVINLVLRIFPKATLRSIIDEILGSLVDEFIMKTPSLLALIPKDRYPAIRDAKLKGNEDLAYIMEMTDEYYECQTGLEERLKMLNKTYGTDFYYLAGYDLEFGGFSSDYKFFQFLKSTETTNSDEIIQISSTATGATYAPAGKQLATYNEKYVTPDKSVDLSTCIFPDNVWLFKGQKHELENNNTALKLALTLACGNESEARSVYPKVNGSRDLKKLKRDYIPDLKAWIAKGNTLNAEQQKVYDDVLAMIDNVNNDRDADDKKIEALVDMMRELGIYGAKGEAETDTFTEIMRKVNNGVYNFFGAKGYVDKFNIFA